MASGTATGEPKETPPDNAKIIVRTPIQSEVWNFLDTTSRGGYVLYAIERHASDAQKGMDYEKMAQDA